MSDSELLNIDPIKDVPLAPSVAVSALAMNFALKFCDITTVQDGQLYQQYKLEGKNMQPLYLAYVMEVAQHYEKWLLNSENRQIQLMRGEIIDRFVEDATEVLGEALDQIIEQEAEEKDQ